MQKYIPSPQYSKDIYSKHIGTWSVFEKFPIGNIQIDSRFFSYPNQVDIEYVKNIVKDFDVDIWDPILLNEDFYLLDGQHRLKAAEKLNLTHIDVIIQHVANYSYFLKNPLKNFQELTAQARALVERLVYKTEQATLLSCNQTRALNPAVNCARSND